MAGMRSRLTWCCALLALVFAREAIAQQQHGDAEIARVRVEALRDAPFEVVAFSSTHVRVDIGADRTQAKLLRRATILTEAGPIAATLVRARRVCSWLCAVGEEDSRECATTKRFCVPRLCPHGRSRYWRGVARSEA